MRPETPFAVLTGRVVIIIAGKVIVSGKRLSIVFCE